MGLDLFDLSMLILDFFEDEFGLSMNFILVGNKFEVDKEVKGMGEEDLLFIIGLVCDISDGFWFVFALNNCKFE